MDRKKEIEILIEYLKNDVIETARLYPSLLSKTIIDHGKLIEKYEQELETLE